VTAGEEMRLQSAAGVADGDWERTTLSSLQASAQGGAEECGSTTDALIRGERVISVRHLEALRRGPAQQRVGEAIVLPVKLRTEDRAIGTLIAGINPTRKLDDDYRTFYQLVASHVATAIANARAYQEESKRAQALAELDKAKTIFFSNISHEFRTPLTLMLGPIESALARPDTFPGDRVDVELLHRNAIRLLKLVNALLDFSRLEAGRIEAHYEPVDLSVLTSDLASVFRSAAEKAGLRLRLQCEPLSQAIYVDREMWEKIVLNLLSNALKSTFDGEIAVTLRESEGAAEVTVRDTGTGIPTEEIPHLFERFRRIEGARRRTNEGSGIGLALVHELVTMHAGTITVESALGVGTTFRIRLPFGTAHLPAERVADIRLDRVPSSAAAYVQEALSWLPGSQVDPDSALQVTAETTAFPASPGSSAAGTVLLVDDNRDMREYVRRLLSQRFIVRTAENGKIALEMACANPPDLVLTDVMMPEMDGFQLLSALRTNAATSGVPVIMLSARAGEEARVEGLESGADDYLVKPFTAQELIARVDSHIRMAQFRRQAWERELELQQAVQRERNLAAEALEHISDGFWTFDSEWRIRYMNPAAEAISKRPRGEQIGRTLWELFPDVVGTELERQFQRAMTNQQMTEFEWIYEPWQRWFRHRIYPTPDGGVAVYVRDSTESRLTEQALRRAEQLSAAGKLAASIAHEINNPLEAVTNLLFLARHAPELLPETRRHLQIADGELQRLSHIARTNLKFYRQSSSPSLVSIQELLDSVLMVYQARVTKSGIQLKKDYGEVPRLRCFPGELQQVFTNLISNALDALGKGGTLLVSVRPSRGGSGLRSDGVRVTVADSGQGMDAGTKARLFEPFFTTKMETGTGLGLWVTKGIVDKHAGTIKVLTSPRRGTAVSVFFPHNVLSESATA
jgi:signal transduction histidine kinase